LRALAIFAAAADSALVQDEVQSSGTILMVRPAAFGFHAEAARSNAFAAPLDGQFSGALREFETMAEQLGEAGVEVLVLDDTANPAKPDAVFPNNWVSFHADGTMVLYPMATAARRLERVPEALAQLLRREGFQVRRTVDLAAHERDGRFLEGTGSLILDRPRRHAYASRSVRTDASVVGAFDQALGYDTMVFDAFDRHGRPIYHTNVLLSLGTGFAILCAVVVPEQQRKPLIDRIEATGRILIQVDYDQLRSFACNIIELHGDDGPVIALSSTALRSFTPDQGRRLERFGRLVAADIPTIEAVGGGSVRCMIAEVHLPRV
jgi:hypothetical protein